MMKTLYDICERCGHDRYDHIFSNKNYGCKYFNIDQNDSCECAEFVERTNNG